MKSYLGLRHSPLGLLSNTSTNKTANGNTNTVKHKCKQNRKCKYCRRHKYKIGGERNVEMKSYLGLSHSPPGLLSNTFCRRRW